MDDAVAAVSPDEGARGRDFADGRHSPPGSGWSQEALLSGTPGGPPAAGLRIGACEAEGGGGGGGTESGRGRAGAPSSGGGVGGAAAAELDAASADLCLTPPRLSSSPEPDEHVLFEGASSARSGSFLTEVLRALRKNSVLSRGRADPADVPLSVTSRSERRSKGSLSGAPAHPAAHGTSNGTARDDEAAEDPCPATARHRALPIGMPLSGDDTASWFASAANVGPKSSVRRDVVLPQPQEVALLRDLERRRPASTATLRRQSARRVYSDTFVLAHPSPPASCVTSDREIAEVDVRPSFSAVGGGPAVVHEAVRRGSERPGNSQRRRSRWSRGDFLTFSRRSSDRQTVPGTQPGPADEVAGRWRTAGSKAKAFTSLFRNSGQTLRDHLRGARLEGLLFPMFPSFLAVPAYAFQTDSKGRKAPPILLEALKLAVTDSDKDKTRLRLRIELEYGDVRWVIHRTMYDFVRLHSFLSLKHFQGLLPRLPHLPSAIAYAVSRVKTYPGPAEGREERRGKIALERRKALETYLLQLLKVLNLKVCYELLAFLELSALSIQPGMGYKGKEGLLQHRIGSYIFSPCVALQRRRWKPRWVMVRDSFIAVGRDVAARHPDKVFLCDRFFVVACIQQHHNPIHRHRITVSNRTERLEFACDSERNMMEWKEHFTKLKESLWSKEHRWGSFAPVRNDSFVRWFVDGEDYFWAVSEALLAAKRTIYVADWWLSPELYLRRPPALNREYRLDRILRAKAQEGVQIRIFVYKEVTYALPISSKYTKLALQRGLHPNITVQRHPDHLPGGTMFWAHHEKMVIIDQDVAFVGGLDLCYGRYDDNIHRLADNGVTAPVQETWPGQDYSNPRIRDFKDVHHFDMELIDRRMLPRMPWHDVHVGMVGQAARDVARHFIQRWNFVGKSRKLLPLSDYTGTRLSAAAETLLRPAKYYFASGPVVGAPADVPVAIASYVPGKGKFADPPRALRLPSSADATLEEDADGTLHQVTTATEKTRESPRAAAGDRSHPSSNRAAPNPNPGVSIPASRTLDRYSRTPPPTTSFATPTSTCQVQVLRQSAQWSSGIAQEASVYKAWYELISEAKHFVYIENQFFVTTTGQAASGIKNQLGEAIVNRIRRAYKEKTKFRIIVVMPLLPAFEAALSEPAASTVRLIVRYQYESICRGPNSVYETLKKFGINPADYIEFFGLRRWDTIVAGQQQSAEDDELQQTDVLSIQDAQDTNTQSPEAHETGSTLGRSSARIRARQSTSHMSELEANDENNEVRNQMDGERGSDSGESDSEGKKRDHLIHVKVRKLRASRARTRQSAMEARKLAAREVHSRESESRANPPLEIAEPAALEEGRAVVTEQIYVHSKLLIVDDTYIVCGSANLNDRSMCGNRDSEIALFIDDKDMVDSKMNGVDFKVGRFAHSLRVHLFKEHLGLLDCQQGYDADDELVGKAATIKDPLAPEFYERLWKQQARVNTEKFREVFRCVPDDTVTTWEEYRKFTPDPNLIMTGHTVLRDESVEEVQRRLRDIKGHLVEFPLNFLRNDVLEASVLSKESIAPVEIFT